MNTNLNANEKQYIFYILFGFFSCMPLISIKGYTIFIWLSGVFIIISIIEGIMKDDFGKYRSYCNWYLVIVIFSIISAVICLTSSMVEKWKVNQLKNMALVIIYYLIFIIFASDNTSKKAIYFLKGLYYSAIFQVLWGIMQLLFYKKGLLLNDIVFIDILHMANESVTQIKDTGIALSGLCWNAANMAALTVFGYIYTKKNYIKIMFVIFSIICGNRTVLIGVVIAVMLEILWNFLIDNLKIRYGWLVTLTIFGFLVAMFIVFNSDIRNALLNKAQSIVNIFSLSTIKTQGSASIHSRYLTSVPQLLKRSLIEHCLFGYGLGNSGYPFTEYLGQWNWLDLDAWVVECQHIDWLWSTGIVGFVLNLSWLVFYMYKGGKSGYGKKMMLFLAVVLIQGFFYNIIFNWCLIAIMCIIVVFENKRQLYQPQSSAYRNS
nr:hypothetical protein [uncultured Anaerostipes sp.]